MENNNMSDFPPSCNSAVPSNRMYSAKELGEMINIHPADFFRVDFGLCTDWYTNDEYMEELMSYVVEEKRMDELISIILLKQQQQTFKHHPKVCYRVPDERKYVPYVADLSTKLSAMRLRVLHEREVNAKLKEMETMWSINDYVDISIDKDTIIKNTSNETPLETIETSHPVFEESTKVEPPHYHLSDLPKEVQDQILISDDNVYSDFVETLHGPVKNWIDKHRLQDWNVVRFICKLRGIFTRKCSISIFSKFLEEIGFGNQENNMKQRKDANSPNAMVIYDDPIKSQNIYKLKTDGNAIEKLLESTIKRMAA